MCGIVNVNHFFETAAAAARPRVRRARVEELSISGDGDRRGDLENKVNQKEKKVNR